MKKALYLLALPVLLLAASCIKEIKLNEEKDYTCECTYVADALGPNAGQPNKVERETFKATSQGSAKVTCDGRGSKYSNQFYGGTCLLK